MNRNLSLFPFVLCCTGTLELVDQRWGEGFSVDENGEVAERDGSVVRLKQGGAFYAPQQVVCLAVQYPKIVAGSLSGELYHLEVLDDVDA